MPKTDRLSPEYLVNRSRRNRHLLVLASIALLAFLMVVFFLIQWNTNRNHAFQTASAVVEQVENVIENNDKKRQMLTESLKEDYATRAKAVSYILDESPESIGNQNELKEIAALIGVDEIHLFDETGTIYSGTTPSYFGLSFDSGDQIAYFKPMLSDKTLSMCQDIVPNTAEGKSMMYAICWNDAGTRMTQIGIEPVHLLKELRLNQISEVISTMPSYSGVDVIVANADSKEVEGSTDERIVGQTLAEIGITLPGEELGETRLFNANIAGRPCYCAAHTFPGHIIVAAQNLEAANEDMGRTMGLLALVLLAAAAIFFAIVRRLMAEIASEKTNAMTDQMTGFYNRRAYEEALAQGHNVETDDLLVVVAMDLDGLKKTNDTLGHAAGDKLIKGAASCMHRCFGSYGSLYRIGGDEFAALIYAGDDMLDVIMKDFESAQAEWTSDNGMALVISCGVATVRENSSHTLSKIADIADKRMYQTKVEHHSHA